MKKKSVYSVVKGLFVVVTGMLVVFNAETKAFNGNGNNLKLDTTPRKEEAVTINYVGSSDEEYYFHVKYNNPLAEEFFFSILDASGETLYEGSFRDKKFSKKFALSKSAVNERLSFVISPLKSKKSEQYDVAITTNFVEDVVVSKN